MTERHVPQTGSALSQLHEKTCTMTKCEEKRPVYDQEKIDSFTLAPSEPEETCTDYVQNSIFLHVQSLRMTALVHEELTHVQIHS